jgi:hypothetical protein
MYGFVHHGSDSMTWVACSVGASLATTTESLACLALGCVANANSLVADLILMDHSNISSKETPGGIGKHFDLMLAKEWTSSLLSQPMCLTS